jgi:hypothetical protein
VTANVKAITCCLGYEQLYPISSATGFTVPPRDPISGMDVKANFALIVAEAQDVRWLDNGQTPTASYGMLLKAGTIFQYDGDLNKIKFIEVTSGAKVNVSYYV